MTLSAMICKRYSPVIILTVKFLMIYNYKETSLTVSSTVLIVWSILVIRHCQRSRDQKLLERNEPKIFMYGSKLGKKTDFPWLNSNFLAILHLGIPRRVSNVVSYCLADLSRATHAKEGIQLTPDNSNLALSRTKIDSPWSFVIHLL